MKEAYNNIHFYHVWTASRKCLYEISKFLKHFSKNDIKDRFRNILLFGADFKSDKVLKVFHKRPFKYLVDSIRRFITWAWFILDIELDQENFLDCLNLNKTKKEILFIKLKLILYSILI